MKDKCNCCGVETLYDRETHIDFRVGYIEGAGQLCLECYDKIYIKPKKIGADLDSTFVGRYSSAAEFE